LNMEIITRSFDVLDQISTMAWGYSLFFLLLHSTPFQCHSLLHYDLSKQSVTFKESFVRHSPFSAIDLDVVASPDIETPSLNTFLASITSSASPSSPEESDVENQLCRGEKRFRSLSPPLPSPTACPVQPTLEPALACSTSVAPADLQLTSDPPSSSRCPRSTGTRKKKKSLRDREVLPEPAFTFPTFPPPEHVQPLTTSSPPTDVAPPHPPTVYRALPSPLFFDTRSDADRSLVTSYCPPLAQITNPEQPADPPIAGLSVVQQVALNEALKTVATEAVTPGKKKKKGRSKAIAKPKTADGGVAHEAKLQRVYTVFDAAKRRRLTQLYNDPAMQFATATQFAVRIHASLERTRFYLQKLRSGQSIEEAPTRRGRPSKVSSLFLNQKIRDMFADDAALTLREAAAQLKDDPDQQLHVSHESVRKVLATPPADAPLLPIFTWKRTQPVSASMDEDRVKEDRIRFIGELQTHRSQGHSFVFVDETAWNIQCIRPYAWSVQGEKAPVDRPPIAESLTAITSISDAGVGHTEIVRGPVSAAVFTAYVRRLLESLCGRGTQCIVMDNASVHHGAAPDIVSAARHAVVFLAPYSPALNPIENVFGIWKGRVEKEIVRWRGFPEFLIEVRQKLLSISVDEVRRTIRAVEANVWPKVLARERL
jgi:transposase